MRPAGRATGPLAAPAGQPGVTGGDRRGHRDAPAPAGVPATDLLAGAGGPGSGGAAGAIADPGTPVVPGRGGHRSRRVAQAAGGSRAGQRGGGTAPGRTGTSRRTGRGTAGANRLLAGLLAVPVVVVIAVVAVYVYLHRAHAAPGEHPAASPPAVAASSSAPGPWQDIATRADDPIPLSVQELFPARFSAQGVSGVRTVTKPGTNCARYVYGSALRSAVRKAGCTQIMRASYLSGDQKLMATIGVLNLASAADAEKVGRVTGTNEFISQLPAAHGPTRKLSQGTGLEEAEVKGHYLIMIWAEYANLHAPSRAAQRTELETFSKDLISGTVNVSLTSRMVTGKPRIP